MRVLACVDVQPAHREGALLLQHSVQTQKTNVRICLFAVPLIMGNIKNSRNRSWMGGRILPGSRAVLWRIINGFS